MKRPPAAPRTRERRTRATAPRRAAAPAPPPDPVPLRHPAHVAALLVAGACVLAAFAYRFYDTDLWTLLVYGKALWEKRTIPMTDEWAWVSFGDPQVTSSWSFRAAIWPLWSAWGAPGLFALRWAVLLATFAILWAAARRMGARGMAGLVAIVWCAVAYRLRAEIRPEMAAALLIAVELWILETRRNGGPDRTPWLVATSIAWANVHISYYVGLFLIAFYVADAWRGRRSPGRMALVWVACAAASFVNPFGWRALWQPFEFALFWRNEPMFRNVLELQPLDWAGHARSGLPVLMAAWPALLLVRARRCGLDLAETLCCVAFTALAWRSQRFLGFYAPVAAPFVARGLAHALALVPAPRWLRPAWARAALVAAACVGLSIPEWLRPGLPFGAGVTSEIVPRQAVDFMRAHGIQGRTFNHFHLGGYLAYRGWPERDRLPFATTQPENLRPDDRRAYAVVFGDPAAWEAFDGRYRFDHLVLEREQDPGDRLLDILDEDSRWALVFIDDVVEVLVRRDGPHARVAEQYGYRVLPAGIRRRSALVPAALADTVLRRAAKAELARQIAASSENATARHLLGVLEMMDGDLTAARAQFEAALARNPFLPRVHELLGVIALEQGRPKDALPAFRRERRLWPETVGIDYRIGQAYQALGERRAARAAFERELARHPEHVESREALESLAP